jgi:hypothetical protein
MGVLWVEFQPGLRSGVQDPGVDAGKSNDNKGETVSESAQLAAKQSICDENTCFKVGKWLVDKDRYWHWGWVHLWCWCWSQEAGSDGEDEDTCTQADGAQMPAEDCEAEVCVHRLVLLYMIGCLVKS